MTVSVVIPAYNSERFIVRTVEAVLAQTAAPESIWIVDDGSEDGTVAVLARKFANDSRVNILEAEHTGLPATNRNIGWKRTVSDLVAFCDADDIWYPAKLANDLKVFAARPDVDLVFSMCDYVGKCSPLSRKWSYGPDLAEGEVRFSDLAKGNPVKMSSVVIKRSMLTDCDGFCEDQELRGLEDYDLWLRVAARGSLHFRRARSHRYTVTSDGVSSNRAQMRAGLAEVARRHRITNLKDVGEKAFGNIIRASVKSLRRLSIPADRSTGCSGT